MRAPPARASNFALLFGTLAASVLYEAAAWPNLPTRFAYEPPAVPAPLRLLLAAMAAIVLITELGDLRAAIRLGGRSAIRP